jgi:hypothetical protein
MHRWHRTPLHARLALAEGRRCGAFVQVGRQFLIAIPILCASVAIYFSFAFFSRRVGAAIDRSLYAQFLAGRACYSRMGWETDVLFNKVHQLHARDNVILLGGSTARDGLLPEVDLIRGWTIDNLATAGDTGPSWTQMIAFISGVGHHKFTRRDLIVFHVWYANFRPQSPEETYLYKLLTQAEVFSVDKQGRITQSAGDLTADIVRHSRTIRDGFAGHRILRGLFSYELMGCGVGEFVESLNKFLNRGAPEPSVTGGDVGVARDRATVSSYVQFWADGTKGARIPGKETTAFLSQLAELAKVSTVLVVNMPRPTWHSLLSISRDYDVWVDTQLVPYLQDHGIPFLDYREAIPDSGYCDSVHMLRGGRKLYSERFLVDVSPLVSRLSGGLPITRAFVR